MTDLSNKNVLITGAASGVGRSLANYCANDGANLILWDSDAAGLLSVEQALKPIAVSVRCYTVDFSNHDSIESAAQLVLDDIGQLDVWVGCVPSDALSDVLGSSVAGIESRLALSHLANTSILRGFMPNMIERNNGHVVTVAPWVTQGQPDYAGSSLSALAFDRALRSDIARHGYNIRTTLALPFGIELGFIGVGVELKQPSERVLTHQAQVIYRGLRKNKKRVWLPRALPRWSPLQAAMCKLVLVLQTKWSSSHLVAAIKAKSRIA